MKKYKKGEYRDQFVIARITDLNNCENVIRWAEKFSLMLKKGLILLYISDKNYTQCSVSEASEVLSEINSKINLPYLHSYVALEGKTSKIIHSTGELLNGVMLITQSDNKNKSKNNPNSVDNILKDFSSSRIAYLVFSENASYQKDFNEVVLSMDALKESKEKVLWASYFGRFSSSVIDIYYHRYRDEYLQKQLNLNIGFARKMFRNFSVETRNCHSLNRRTQTDVQALDFAQREDKDLCIFQTTANKGILELFFGLPERKVLELMDKTPVLFLNRRDDLFIMCE
ncbi:MAG: hypothetical protein IJ748_01520 [Bacteroidales bacterium]|nr:hypothetical protein [Bacteroidales bacterium]